ncbi:hypothetical protein COT42_00020 [Candidatus Saganbacteria bacterium CG08_land_8_20_14_0_20_45_16]|uniref:Membrane protein 6-pyruvoyl-tetrahydropterin synthase-related domain-containing protein n=1 Tax=Candidatus Saganbacteria bacterium CG08_land_8_20_14_0_20_45_16 TaxID=2014293 RepID=A0A2H0Y1V0_UNCSA|nr:MAG: hypothetical protein COT42_00020 [Candidatus Saganbacteria bacterium CG08_land_8_20_14_0_20_45_16]
MKKTSWNNLFVFLFFLGGSLLWFYKEAFQGRLFCFSDLTFYFYPYRYFMVECLKQGVIPLWNPNLLLGYPFLATLQTGFFYPLSLLYLLLPFDLAFNWFLLLHYPLAAFFMYLLARDLKRSLAAASASGLVFAFCGYSLSVLHMPTTLASIIWVPLVLLTFRKLLAGPAAALWSTGLRLILFALTLTLVFLGGEPTISYCTLLLLLGYLLIFDLPQFWRGLGYLIAGWCLSAALAAVQLLPFLELLAHSSRLSGLTFTEAAYFSLEPRKLLEFLLPYFFHLTEFPWVETGWLKVPYLGIVPLTLALLALLFHQDRRRWLLVGAALLLLLVIGGSYSPIPLYALLFKYVPGFGFFRYPIKFVFLLVFLLAVAVGFALDLLWQLGPRLKKGLEIILLGWLVLFGLSLCLAKQPVVFWLLLQPLFSQEISQGLTPYLTQITVPRDLANLLLSQALVLVLLFWAWVGAGRLVRRPFFLAGLVALIFFDLFSANANSNLVVNQSEYKIVPPNVLRLKQDQSLFRCFASPRLYFKARSETVNDFYHYPLALAALRNRLCPNQNMLFGLVQVDGYESIRGVDQEEMIKRIALLDRLDQTRVLDLLNIKYLVTAGRLAQPGYKLVSYNPKDAKGTPIFLYENQHVLPRAFLVKQARIIKDRRKILAYLFSNQFEPQREVILEADPHQAIDQAKPNGLSDQVLVKEYSPNRVRLEVVSSQDQFLFLSDWYYPGWQATVAGQPVVIRRANYMFRAIRVGPGRQTVEFVYRPASFIVGAAISLLTWLGMVFWLALGWWRLARAKESVIIKGP